MATRGDITMAVDRVDGRSNRNPAEERSEAVRARTETRPGAPTTRTPLAFGDGQALPSDHGEALESLLAAAS